MANLIGKVEKTYDRHYIYFKAQFDDRPTHREIAQVQDDAGYPPAGYGGPSQVEINAVWEVKWRCSNSCD